MRKKYEASESSDEFLECEVLAESYFSKVNGIAVVLKLFMQLSHLYARSRHGVRKAENVSSYTANPALPQDSKCLIQTSKIIAILS
jgi:hypothetical protein